MKIQSLAIIFVIIILPISILLSEYTQALITTVSLQTSYQSSLISATYDAVTAYQLNSLNDSSTTMANSKIRDIEASANTFLTSIGTHFKMSGESSKTINDYVPAIVFTMYDGYYIYSPYENDIEDVYASDEIEEAATYKDDEELDGLKPYVYYSCRYETSSCDVVITYSLDNYITVQGWVNGTYYNKSGYFLDKVKMNGTNITYAGIQIDQSEGQLKEQVFILGSSANTNLSEDIDIGTYPYVKINSTKYYLDETDPSNPKAFYIQNGEINENVDEEIVDLIKDNKTAYTFYKNAYEFTDWIQNSPLYNLKFNDAVDENGDAIHAVDGNGNRIDINGFKEDEYIFKGAKDAEEEESNFTTHRTAVIRYTIEKNLSIAIANYDQKFGGSTSFSMPNLSEEDWYKLISKPSIMTFLQGIPMGTKIYNGYAVITNNTNKDVVTDASIYVVTENGTSNATYHRIDEEGLESRYGSGGTIGRRFYRLFKYRF